MKVLFIGTAGKYGAQLSLGYLCKILKDKGIDVEVVLPERGNTEKIFSENKIKYYVIKNGLMWTGKYGPFKRNFIKFGKFFVNYIAENQIRFIIKKDNIDIVHINSIGVGVGAKSAIKEQRKLVWHIREFVEEDLNRKLYDESRTYDYLNKADAVIAISRAVYDKYKANITNPNFHVIYNGIEPLVYSCADRTILNENIKVKIIVPGRICYEKGQACVVDALEYLRDMYGEILIDFCGDGNGNNRELAILQNRVRQNRWEKIVSFSGYSSCMELKYQEADICIVPSKMEAFGRVTVEAMMAGCLLVGSNTGGTQELLADGRGLLFDFGDGEQLAKQIRWAMENRARARKIAQDAKIYALREYSARKNADDIARVYEKLFDKE